MTSATSNDLVTFTPDTKAAFLQYLLEHPNSRRISQSDKEKIVGWLTNPHQRPSSQKEFSRRNYVRKTFIWDENTQNLLEIAKTGAENARLVVTEDMIPDVVENVHKENGHSGWDYTWKAVSTSYYGILRSDLIFLLKECQVCAQNPSKRPKGSQAVPKNAQPVDQQILDFGETNTEEHDISEWETLESEELSGP